MGVRSEIRGVPSLALTFSFDVVRVANDSSLWHCRVASLHRTIKRQNMWKVEHLTASYSPQSEINMACAHHCILDLCSPQPVATDVHDIVHPPRDLVVPSLSSVSSISSEVVACTTMKEFRASTSEPGPRGALVLPEGT